VDIETVESISTNETKNTTSNTLSSESNVNSNVERNQEKKSPQKDNVGAVSGKSTSLLTESNIHHQFTNSSTNNINTIATTPKIKKRCEYCGVSETPMWRRGPGGTGSLCNACGVKWKHGKIMPDNKVPETYVTTTPRSSGPRSRQSRKGNGISKSVSRKSAPVTTSFLTSSSSLPSSNPSTSITSSASASTKIDNNNNNNSNTTNHIDTNATMKSSSSASSNTIMITYEQKKELSERIPILEEDKLMDIVDIIRRGVDEDSLGEGEVEIDLEKLDPKIVKELWDYVQNVGRS